MSTNSIIHFAPGAIGTETFDVVANCDEITREEWLEIRRAGIGGSDVGGIMGLSQWKTPLSLYMDKLGQSAPVEETEPMYWGNVLEDVVAQEFQKRTGHIVGRYPYLMRSKEYPWMLANIDRLVVDGDNLEVWGLECKSAHALKAKDWEDGKVPDDYLLQCYHYMIVLGLKKFEIACLIGGQKYETYTIHYDDSIAQAVIEHERAFWQMVQDQQPPAAWGQDIDILAVIYGPTSNTTVALDPDATTPLIERYLAAQAAEKQAVAEKDAAKASLCEMIGANAKATVGKYKLNWTEVNTDRLDSTRLKAEQPAIYQQYTKTTSSRRFSVK